MQNDCPEKVYIRSHSLYGTKFKRAQVHIKVEENDMR